MPKVTLVLAAGPGFPQGSTEHRYEFEVTLDAQAQPDAAQWYDDPKSWPATRTWPDEPERQGDLQHEPDTGWYLRFYARPEDAADAPHHAVNFSGSPVRPGETLTIQEPDGVAYAWRVVQLG